MIKPEAQFEVAAEVVTPEVGQSVVDQSVVDFVVATVDLVSSIVVVFDFELTAELASVPIAAVVIVAVEDQEAVECFADFVVAVADVAAQLLIDAVLAVDESDLVSIVLSVAARWVG